MCYNKKLIPIEQNSFYSGDQFIVSTNSVNNYSYSNKSQLKLKNSSRNNNTNNKFFDNIEIKVNVGYLKEIEELYNTNSIYQVYSVSKKVNDLLKLGLSIRIEYAQRNEVEKEKVKRWFDNAQLKSDFTFNDYNNISIFVGGSISDTTITSYGAVYNTKVEFDELVVRNQLTLSYDYFYYWNEVSQKYLNDNVSINYKGFTLTTGYFYGVVDLNYVDGYDDKAKNPNSAFSAELQYDIMSSPLLNVGASYNSRDFKYYSPLYFSPQDRKLTGIFSNFYNSFGKLYLYLGGGYRVDNSDVKIWSFDSEVGYEIKNFNIAVGLNRYNDPYYTNYNTFLSINKIF